MTDLGSLSISCFFRMLPLPVYLDEDYSATEGYCAALTYSLGGFTAINPGYEWIGWR